jgi:3-demethoxyubiquinol 3-hydroxylase
MKKLRPKMSSSKEEIESMIRVNHAGEYGAKRIYLGQLSVLKGNKKIQEMYEQELKHLEYFENEMKKRRVRPTILSPLWHFGGFAMGAITALMSEKAAMLCTVAVEEVIEDHYRTQLDELSDNEHILKTKIKQFRAEEMEHKDIGLQSGAHQAPGHKLLKSAIKAITKTAIALSKRY